MLERHNYETITLRDLNEEKGFEVAGKNVTRLLSIILGIVIRSLVCEGRKASGEKKNREPFCLLSPKAHARSPVFAQRRRRVTNNSTLVVPVVPN